MAAVDPERLRRHWPQIKSEVRDRWGRLSEEDVSWIDGEPDRWADAIQAAYGMAREEAMRQVATFTATMETTGRLGTQASSTDQMPGGPTEENR